MDSKITQVTCKSVTYNFLIHMLPTFNFFFQSESCLPTLLFKLQNINSVI